MEIMGSGKFHGLLIFGFLAITLNALGCSAQETKGHTPDYLWKNAHENPQKLKNGVVKVVVPNIKQGTGFIVKIKQNSVFVVTAYHVVENANQINVKFHGDSGEFPADIFHYPDEKEDDIAVLQINAGNRGIPGDLAELKLGSIYRTDEGGYATVVGIPGMLNNWIADRCKILAISNQITFAGEAVSQGSSGSPIIKNNRVIGMFKEMRPTFRFAVRSDRILNVLYDLGVLSPDSETPGPTSPAEMSESQLFGLLPPASSKYDREQWICHNKLNDFRVEFENNVNNRNRQMLRLERLDSIQNPDELSAEKSRIRSELDALGRESTDLKKQADSLWKEWRLACRSFDEQIRSVAETVLKELSLRLEANAREDRDLASRL